METTNGFMEQAAGLGAGTRWVWPAGPISRTNPLYLLIGSCWKDTSYIFKISSHRWSIRILVHDCVHELISIESKKICTWCQNHWKYTNVTMQDGVAWIKSWPTDSHESFGIICCTLVHNDTLSLRDHTPQFKKSLKTKCVQLCDTSNSLGTTCLIWLALLYLSALCLIYVRSPPTFI